MSGSPDGNGESAARECSNGELPRVTPEDVANKGKRGGSTTGNVWERMNSLKRCAK